MIFVALLCYFCPLSPTSSYNDVTASYNSYIVVVMMLMLLTQGLKMLCEAAAAAASDLSPFGIARAI